MSLSLNHYSVRTSDLESTRRFYVDLLGLQVGPRPDFPFPGLWLYAGDTGTVSNAAVHIIGIDPADVQGLKDYLGNRDGNDHSGSGALDHIAFAATGLSDMRRRVAGLGVPVRERTVPGLGLHQLFLDDPNGIVIELNYPAAEAV